MSVPPSDLGIVLYASGDGGGSFVGRDGNPGTVRTLTEAHFIASDWIEAGRHPYLYLTVSGIISLAMASVVVMLERRRRDEQNPSLFEPALIGTYRADNPSAPKAAQQTILRADLVGQSVSDWPDAGPATETLDVALTSTDHRWSGGCRVLVKATNAPEAGDRIVVGVNAGQ